MYNILQKCIDILTLFEAPSASVVKKTKRILFFYQIFNLCKNMQTNTENKIFLAFANFFAGVGSVSLAMLIGVLFLMTGYQNVIHLINPQNKTEFVYWEMVRVFISHLDSLFFALCTTIIIFQCKDEKVKILFCGFESVFIFLNFSRERLPVIFGISQELTITCLVIYISVFSGFAFFFLGMLATMHHARMIQPATVATPTVQTTSPTPEKTRIGFPITTVDTLPQNKAETTTEQITTFLQNLPMNQNNPKTESLPADDNTGEQKKVGRKTITPAQKDIIQAPENKDKSLAEVAELAGVKSKGTIINYQKKVNQQENKGVLETRKTLF